jgi:predicted GIY-YIG superfamily endonuclease
VAGVVSYLVRKGKTKGKQAAPATRRWEKKYTFWIFFASTVIVFYLTDLTTAVAFLIGIVTAAALTRFWVWRHYWIKALAADGLPNPGVFKLRKQVRLARKRKDVVVSQFELAVMNNPKLLGTTSDRQKRMPPVRAMQLTADGNVAAEVDMAAIGKTIDDLQGAANEIAEVCRCKYFVVRRRENCAHVTWQFTDPLETVLRFQDLRLPERRGDKKYVVLGVDELNRPMQIPLAIPTLIAGAQGSGKSVAAWDYFGSLIQQGIPTRIYLIDAKQGQEFGVMGNVKDTWQGTINIAASATDVEGGLEVIAQWRKDVATRAMELGREGIRNFSAFTFERPLLLLAIDEALEFAPQMKQSTSELKSGMRQARAAGGTVLGLVQYANLEEMGQARKLFGNKVGFRADAEVGLTMFGKRAVEMGADTSRIPMDTPGIGFYQDEKGGLVKFRSAHVTDPVADLLQVGELPDDMGLGRIMPVEQDWAVYLLPNRDAECIYIGTSGYPKLRLKQHADDKPWWPEVDQKRIRIIWCKGGEPAALKLEAKLTDKFMPLYPVENNTDNPLRHDWRHGELAAHRPPIIAPKQIEAAKTSRWRKQAPVVEQVEPEVLVDAEILDGELLEDTEYQPYVASGSHWGSE